MEIKWDYLALDMDLTEMENKSYYSLKFIQYC